MELTIKTSISYKFSTGQKEEKKTSSHPTHTKKKLIQKSREMKENVNKTKGMKKKTTTIHTTNREWTKSRGDAIKRFSLLSHYLPEFVFLSVGRSVGVGLILQYTPLFQPRISCLCFFSLHLLQRFDGFFFC